MKKRLIFSGYPDDNVEIWVKLIQLLLTTVEKHRERCKTQLSCYAVIVMLCYSNKYSLQEATQTLWSVCFKIQMLSIKPL